MEGEWETLPVQGRVRAGKSGKIGSRVSRVSDRASINAPFPSEADWFLHVVMPEYRAASNKLMVGQGGYKKRLLVALTSPSSSK